MNKRELALLERGFSAEIDFAINGAFPIFQSKSKLALKLVDEGLLAATEINFHGVVIKGFALTLAGNMTYCDSCKDDQIESE